MMSANDNEFNSQDIEIVANTTVEDFDETELPYGDEAEDDSLQRTSLLGGILSKRNKIIIGITTILLVLCVAGFGGAAAQYNRTVASFSVGAAKASKAPKASKTPKRRQF